MSRVVTFPGGATPYDGFFREAAALYNVPAKILTAVAWTESSMGQQDGPGDGIGIMQVLASTGRALGFSEADLHDARLNIMAGAAALQDIIARQGGVISLADMYSEYNSGRKDLWRTSSQVQQHVKNFLGNLATKVEGIQLPANWTIDDALAALSTNTQTSLSAVVLMMVFIAYFKKR